MVQAIDPALVDRSLYDSSLAYYVRPGADIYPIPGSILLYTENQGYPDFDLDRAKRFQMKVFKKIEEFLRSVLKQWEAI